MVLEEKMMTSRYFQWVLGMWSVWWDVRKVERGFIHGDGIS